MTAFSHPHQYVDRETSRVVTEPLMADRLVAWLYSRAREQAPLLYRAATAPFFSSLLGYFHFDAPLGRPGVRAKEMARRLGIDLAELVDPAGALRSPRRLFERQIRYWTCRPMADHSRAVVSPADARMTAGAFSARSLLFLKEKFFRYEELIGPERTRWIETFREGFFMIFRLTPEKYHYNHNPVAGRVVDIYGISGACHSCNPGAVVAEVTPFSKNGRVVTVIDTDVPGGTAVGKVAMIEVVALMIGQVLQCYSRRRYEAPREVTPGLFLEKGQPKSLYRPGSSVDVLLFEKGRIEFSDDIVRNLNRRDVRTRFAESFGKPLVETDVRVRSTVAMGMREDGSAPLREASPNR